MEIETIKIESHGDKIIIPEGYKAQINGNEVVIKKKEGMSKDFNRGDILVSLHNEIILVDDYDIVEDYLYSFVHIDCFGVLSKVPYRQWCERSDFRLATEEEKQLLFDKMKEQGLKWNAEEKRVEEIRWRAEKGEEYHFLSNGLTEGSATETNVSFDKELWDSFNYFRTEEQAEEAARRVKETLRKYHEEIGE
ncbi:MAG: hypothetical protein HG422_08320 [Prevotella sp.]|nr:hypothetical protein [Prevotella sp.]